MAEATTKPEPELQAEPTESGFGGRRIPRETNVDALTPTNIRSLLLNAEGGDIAAQAELFELMEERDGELGAHLRTRKAGVAQADWTIEPADDTPGAEAVAEFCREVVEEIPDIHEVIFDLLDAVGKGFAVQEIEWQTGRTVWAPLRLIYRPQRWFTLAGDGRTLLIRGETSTETIEMNPLNFVVHRVRGQSGFEWRTGLLRACIRPFVVRFYSWKDWMAFAEVFGMPARVGKLREGAAWDGKEATQLYAAVRALGQDYAAVIQGGNEIEFLEVSSRGTSPYQDIIEKAGRELTLAILGQTLTSGGEGGGSYALGKVHNQVRWDLIKTDAQSLERTFTEQLLRPIVRLNKGPTAPVPLWNFVVEEPEDLAQVATTIKTLIEAGLPIPVSYAQEKFGIPEPEEGEEILVPAAVRALTGAAAAGGGDEAEEGEAEEAGEEIEVQNALVLNQAEGGVVAEDGLAWLREKRVADEAAWNALSPAGRQRVWYVTGLEQDRIAQVASELIEGFASGQSQGEFLGRLEEMGISVPGGEKPGAGQIPAAQARLVEHQNRMSAYGADRWIKAQRTKATRPHGQYHTAGDDRVRAEHAAMEGIIKPLDDPFWGSWTPPCDMGCRCTMTTISNIEMEDEGLAVGDEAEEAARYQTALMLQGQIYGPDEFNAGWRGLLPAMRERESVAGLKAPANPQFTFDRNDAYGLTEEGWEPRTEEGRRDWELLRLLPMPSEF